MSTRTQNIVDGEQQYRRDPIDVKLLTETYRKRLNTIFTIDPLSEKSKRRAWRRENTLLYSAARLIRRAKVAVAL
ncbi:hypothetical protein ASD52_31290 [Ensifer sp. Root142]|nr:hypothetical protein ASD03_29945 [Ensifer sp. Root127]KQY69932.1 hypothetical protein ASD52_31290 [Ensifer sp. Root142]OMQ42399.1 hypothetical protein BKP54_23840 [Ensifer sp. 1H6]